MESEKEPLPIGKSYLEKYKKTVLISLAIIIVVIVLVSPIIPIQYTVTKTRTRNLQYNSQLYDKIVAGMDVGPWFVNVTNKDSIGGSFSVTMNYWMNNPNPFSGPSHLNEETFSQSLMINPMGTQTFYVPSSWFVYKPIWSFAYSVSAPTTQENYNVTKTEYKSILNLIVESLK